MEKNKLQIRVATKEDAEALLAIYAPYVEKTAITFEYEVPSIEEFRCRIQETLKKYPYLVAEKNGKIVGYAYAGAFHARPAYDWAVETSIYEHLNKDSVRFHTHLGYRMVGEFYQCGYKFDRWYNMVWMEKHIGAHPSNPAKVIWFSKL